MSNREHSHEFGQRSEDEVGELAKLAVARGKQGLAPPSEIYRVKDRSQIDWSLLPAWAQPTDPDMFEGCCHEG